MTTNDHVTTLRMIAAALEAGVHSAHVADIARDAMKEVENGLYPAYQLERLSSAIEDYAELDTLSAQISYVHEHPWATVQTLDGSHAVQVSISRLLYDEDGKAYLLAFKEEEEKRLYID